MRLLCLLCLLLAPGLVLADDGAKVRAGESPKALGLRTNLTIDQVSAIFVPGFPDSVPNLTDNSRFLEEKNAVAYSGSATEKFDGMIEFAEEPREGRSESAILETALLVKGWKSLCADWFRLAGEPGTMAVTTGVSEAIANLSFRRVVLSCAGHRDEILFAIGADHDLAERERQDTAGPRASLQVDLRCVRRDLSLKDRSKTTAIVGRYDPRHAPQGDAR